MNNVIITDKQLDFLIDNTLKRIIMYVSVDSGKQILNAIQDKVRDQVRSNFSGSMDYMVLQAVFDHLKEKMDE